MSSTQQRDYYDMLGVPAAVRTPLRRRADGPTARQRTALRVPGYGMPAPAHRRVSGDAYVIVRSADPRFVRRGPDLWCSQVIDVSDAVLGTTRTVPTPDGDLQITVLAGTPPRRRVTRPRRLPGYGGTGRGDLNFSMTIRIPEHVTRAIRDL